MLKGASDDSKCTKDSSRECMSWGMWSWRVVFASRKREQGGARGAQSARHKEQSTPLFLGLVQMQLHFIIKLCLTYTSHVCSIHRVVKLLFLWPSKPWTFSAECMLLPIYCLLTPRETGNVTWSHEWLIVCWQSESERAQTTSAWLASDMTHFLQGCMQPDGTVTWLLVSRPVCWSKSNAFASISIRSPSLTPDFMWRHAFACSHSDAWHSLWMGSITLILTQKMEQFAICSLQVGSKYLNQDWLMDVPTGFVCKCWC